MKVRNIVLLILMMLAMPCFGTRSISVVIENPMGVIFAGIGSQQVYCRFWNMSPQDQTVTITSYLSTGASVPILINKSIPKNGGAQVFNVGSNNDLYNGFTVLITEDKGYLQGICTHGFGYTATGISVSSTHSIPVNGGRPF